MNTSTNKEWIGILIFVVLIFAFFLGLPYFARVKSEQQHIRFQIECVNNGKTTFTRDGLALARLIGHPVREAHISTNENVAPIVYTLAKGEVCTIKTYKAMPMGVMSRR